MSCSVSTSSSGPGLGSLMAERRRLLGLGYRMLGSVQDAEDVVQETYARWYALSEAEQEAIDTPLAWLTRVASRICLDQLASARVRRERYTGEWLPEPVRGDTGVWTSVSDARGQGGGDPADRVTLDESVSMGMLVVLDSVTPAERVAFVLHDVFGVPFAEIAETVGRSPAACRQLASSARRRLAERRPAAVTTTEHRRVVSAFLDACGTGDLDALVALLDPAVEARSDGGGRVRAALRPIVGADKVARFLLGLLRKEPGTEVVEEDVNGSPGVTVRIAGATVGVVGVGVRGGRVSDLWLVVNPDKLHAWTDTEADTEADTDADTDAGCG
ncbi:RNA polymerase sigma factor (sigma-70 family) [Streptomyces sp. V3I8]|uniref:RNA polymerase sigma factor SigJ n=1 Tax=Streptomyces sp. V3I8 TaxID=3042279 RepID=UPI0027880CB7|nr:RNA polymerase sigma factor SigJ [Streptomyces sp. V3I8]MDQ1036904.1 RNA polymerase sigma factor (sigma-70 family) [Streptomyces sp. V3I8]